jgi:hypothetical protein
MDARPTILVLVFGEGAPKITYYLYRDRRINKRRVAITSWFWEKNQEPRTPTLYRL